MSSKGGRGRKTALVIGGGPAGLMAAEVLSATGVAVTVVERMPSVARKLLIAGRGGLNLTHSEPFETFVERYGDAGGRLRPLIEAFAPQDLITWAEELGQETFVGSSGRVFPKAMKASPLLRAWLTRLAGQGVTIRTRTEWRGWDIDAVMLKGPEGEERVRPDVIVLALGGGSWPKLGSNGAWVPLLELGGVTVRSLSAANMGINIAWSDAFRERFQGEPLKNVQYRIPFGSPDGPRAAVGSRGDIVVTRYGVEGGAVYMFAHALGRMLGTEDGDSLVVDLRPDMPAEALAERLALAAPGQSTANVLRKAVKLSPLAINLMREGHGKDLPREPVALAQAIKAVPLKVTGVQGLERAISSAGGIALDEVDDHLMLKKMPGVFVAGEMLDWEAPTGGYLLQACFSTGVAAAKGVLAWLEESAPQR